MWFRFGGCHYISGGDAGTFLKMMGKWGEQLPLTESCNISDSGFVGGSAGCTNSQLDSRPTHPAISSCDETYIIGAPNEIQEYVYLKKKMQLVDISEWKNGVLSISKEIGTRLRARIHIFMCSICSFQYNI